LEDISDFLLVWRNPSLLEPGKEQELLKRRNRELHHIKRKEDLSRMHRKIRYTLRTGIERGGLSRVDVPTSSSPLPFPSRPDPKTWEGSWSTLTKPSDIAIHVCAANHRQYNQANTTLFGTEPLASHIGYKADTAGAEEIINGCSLPQEMLHQLLPETQALFNTLSALASNPKPDTANTIQVKQFQECYKVMDERTSSSPSGRHIGHYKAAITSETLSSLHSTMMSIPLVASFSPERWRQVVDIMLTKKAGDYRIHRLCIVALQESEFNQCNRFIISRPLQRFLEDTKLVPDMQHVSWASKLCQSVVLNKQLTFEIHRYAKKPIAYKKTLDAMIG
jgi:hypothetical protein